MVKTSGATLPNCRMVRSCKGGGGGAWLGRAASTPRRAAACRRLGAVLVCAVRVPRGRESYAKRRGRGGCSVGPPPPACPPCCPPTPAGSS
jgi:hypothetical protein